MIVPSASVLQSSARACASSEELNMWNQRFTEPLGIEHGLNGARRGG